MAKSSSSTTQTVNKSAVTGRFVTNSTVTRHPNTTYQQTVKKGK